MYKVCKHASIQTQQKSRTKINATNTTRKSYQSDRRSKVIVRSDLSLDPSDSEETACGYQENRVEETGEDLEGGEGVEEGCR